MSHSYSQIGQDVHVINIIYNGKRDGYFVDVGAHDGISLSNTYLLEKEYAWTGICVEPMPSIFTKMQEIRTASKCYCCAVYSQDDLELEFVEADVLSGIVSHIDSHKWILQNSKIQVKTKTLTTLLNESNAPRYIDYLSLDTEGSELEILRGTDLDKYQFGYINVEHNYVEPRRSQMRQLLESKGYVYDGENNFDDNYILPVSN